MAKVITTQQLANLPQHLRSWVHDARARGRSERTVHLYVTTAQQALKHGGVDDIDQWTTAGLRSYLAHRQATVSPTTVSLEQRALASMANWMVKEELVGRNPMQNVKVQRPPRKVRDILSPGDLDNLIRSTDGHTLDRKRDAAMVSMLAEAGPRVGELVSMDIDSLDLVKNTVEVRGKVGPRVCVFGPRTSRLLHRWLAVRHNYSHAAETRALWVGDRGPLTVDGVAQALARASERAGMERVSPHAVRHAWASALKSHANLPDRVLEVLGGWTPGSAMVRHYGRDVEEQQAIESYRSPFDMDARDRTRR